MLLGFVVSELRLYWHFRTKWIRECVCVVCAVTTKNMISIHHIHCSFTTSVERHFYSQTIKENRHCEGKEQYYTLFLYGTLKHQPKASCFVNSFLWRCWGAWLVNPLTTDGDDRLTNGEHKGSDCLRCLLTCFCFFFIQSQGVVFLRHLQQISAIFLHYLFPIEFWGLYSEINVLFIQLFLFFTWISSH